MWQPLLEVKIKSCPIFHRLFGFTGKYVTLRKLNVLRKSCFNLIFNMNESWRQKYHLILKIQYLRTVFCSSSHINKHLRMHFIGRFCSKKGSRVCFSWWKGQSLLIWSERMLGTWPLGRKLIPSLWWTRSVSTSPVTFRRTAKSRKPTRNSAPWSSCWPALGWSAEKLQGTWGREGAGRWMIYEMLYMHK